MAVRKITFRHRNLAFLAVLIILFGFISFYTYTKLFHPVTHANLTKFHSLTSEDPLFFDPNTDLKRLSAAVLDLKNKDDQITGTNDSYVKNDAGRNNWDIFPKGWRIWPDGFLMMLPTIHEATTSFLSKPTPGGAVALLGTYGQAVGQYKNAIDLHIQALETFISRSPKTATTKILFLGSATTPEIVLADFLLIRKNAQALETELAARKKCLYEGLCFPKKLTDESKQRDAEIIPFNPLPDKLLEIDRSKNKVYGPFQITTGCFGFTEDQKPYRLPLYMVDSNDGRIIIMLTNSKYYRDYRKVPEQAVAQIWLKRGISIRPHEVLTDYLCTDLSQIPYLFLEYLKAKKSPEKSLFSVFPYLLERTALLSQFMIYDLAYAKKPYSPLYLLVDRSAYSLYFGTFTSRIWRLPESPTFLIQKDYSDSTLRAGWIKYENLLAEGISFEKILSFNAVPNILELYKQELETTSSANKK